MKNQSDLKKDLNDLLYNLKNNKTNCINIDLNEYLDDYTNYAYDLKKLYKIEVNENDRWKCHFIIYNKIKEKVLISFFSKALEFKDKILEIDIDLDLGRSPNGYKPEGNVIEENILSHFINFMSQCKHLKIIHLRDFPENCAYSKAIMDRLGNFVAKSELEILSYYNKEVDTTIRSILFKSIEKCLSIKEVSLLHDFGNNVVPNQPDGITHSFHNMLTNGGIQTIKFEQCNFEGSVPRALTTLLMAMCVKNAPIRHIDIGWYPKIDLESFISLAKYLKFKIFYHTYKLQTLIAGEDWFLSAGRLQYLISNFKEKPSTQLETISFCRNEMEENDCQPLLHLLGLSPHLKNLDLRYNQFGTESIKAILNKLKENKNLRELKLDLYGQDTKYDYKIWLETYQHLPKNGPFSNVFWANNTKECQYALADFIKDNQTLQILGINCYGNSDITTLINALKNTNINTLIFSPELFNMGLIERLLQLLKRNQAIRHIFIDTTLYYDGTFSNYDNLFPLEQLNSDLCIDLWLNNEKKKNIMKLLNYNRKIGPQNAFLMGLDNKLGKNSPIQRLTKGQKDCLSALIFSFAGLMTKQDAKVLRFHQANFKSKLNMNLENEVNFSTSNSSSNTTNLSLTKSDNMDESEESLKNNKGQKRRRLDFSI